MGLNLFGSHSSYDDKLPEETLSGKPISREEAYKDLGDPKTWGQFKKEMEEEFKRKPNNPNPNPTNFQIVASYQIAKFLIMKVNYPDCTNYEGNKILVYYDVTLKQLLDQKSIDPHFSNNPEKHSPVARFVPTDEGWMMAEDLANALTWHYHNWKKKK